MLSVHPVASAQQNFMHYGTVPFLVESEGTQVKINVRETTAEHIALPGHASQNNIASHTDKPKKLKRSSVYALVRHQFLVGSSNAVYVGADSDKNIFAGWQIEQDAFTWSANLNIKNWKVFKDPYLLNTNRELTNASEYRLALSWSQQFEDADWWGMMAEHKVLYIQQDETPQNPNSNESLGREGHSNSFILSGKLFVFDMHYVQEWFAAKGTADSFKADEYTISSSFAYPWFLLKAISSEKYTLYNTTHPIFNQQPFSIFSKVSAKIQKGISDSGHSIGLEYFRRAIRSNIKFFEHTETGVSLLWEWQG